MPIDTPFEPTEEEEVIVPVPDRVTVSQPTTFVKLVNTDPPTAKLPS